jgi:hypothetical protein
VREGIEVKRVASPDGSDDTFIHLLDKGRGPAPGHEAPRTRSAEVGFADQLAPAHLQVHEVRVCTPFGYENVWSMEYDPSDRGQQF